MFVAGQHQTDGTVRVHRFPLRDGLPGGAAETQVRRPPRAAAGDDEVAAEPPPGHGSDGSVRRAPGFALDQDVRRQAFLDADAAVGEGVRLVEAGDARSGGEPFPGVPTPRVARRSRIRVPGDDRAPRPPGLREVLRQVRLRQPAGKEQPAVVGNHPNRLPAGVQKGRDPIGEAVEFLREARRQPGLLVVSGLVDFPGFEPAPRRRRTGSVELALAADLVAAFSHRVANGLRVRLPSAGAEAGREGLVERGPFEVASHRSHRRLGGRGNRRKRRPPRLQLRLQAPRFQPVGEAPAEVEAKAVHEEEAAVLARFDEGLFARSGKRFPENGLLEGQRRIVQPRFQQMPYDFGHQLLVRALHRGHRFPGGRVGAPPPLQIRQPHFLRVGAAER